MPYLLCLLFILIPALAGATTQLTRVIRYDDRSGLSSSIVGAGVQDRNGLLWFATWNGLNCYDGYDFHWVKIAPGDSASISTNHIRDIILDENGNIVCHTDDDIFEFNLGSFSFKDIDPERKNSLRSRVGITWKGITDNQGNRWTADSRGLFKEYTLSHPAKLIQATAQTSPRAFLADPSGGLWVGSQADNTIRILDAGGNLSLTINLQSAPYSLFRHPSGNVWAGCKPSGLIRFIPGNLSGESIANEAVYDIASDAGGNLWIATFGNGIKCIPDPSAPNPAISPTLAGRKVRKLMITPRNNLIAASTDGLIIAHIDSLNPAATQFRTIRRNGNIPESVASNTTMSLARDSRGNIFIATESSGIDLIQEEELFSPTPRFRHFNMQNSSLTGDICKAMALASDSLIFVVGNHNVMAFNPIEDTTVNLASLFWNDSCQFTEATPVMLPDSTWVFGAAEGAFHTSLANLYRRDCTPPLVFTTLAINGAREEFSLTHSSTISLGKGERNISVHFAALDFIDNSGILYRTSLDNSLWTAGDHSRSVALFNLAPGEHTLKVQSTDRYGRWVDNTRSLLIIVPHYWYETLWARLLFLLLGVCLSAGVILTVLYIRRVNRNRHELLEKYMALLSQGECANGSGPSASHPAPSPDPAPIAPQPEESPLLNRVRKYITENIDNPDANVDAMAKAAAASRSTLNRHLRSQLGISAARLLIEARMQHACRILQDTPGDIPPIADIAHQCGYTDPRYFQRVFREKYGKSPSEFKGSL